ncbi:glycerophosphodiester phosphodiesterase [Paeniglutamicibacter sp. MACA_103]|uniref:glycerophosphodiester phosphodiesterase n=1 Tax=Paeniglutamicibacter sp. MACA_103 TaxID=3377337 RepID=UPI0038954311
MDTARVGTARYLLNTAGSALAGSPLAFAHRGFAPDGAENTLKAFAAAHELGFAYLETDVRATQDGVLVVFHDEDLFRLTGDRRKVADCTAAELSALRVKGEPIPAFDQLLRAFPRAHFNVDVKDARSAALLADAIARHGAHERVLVASFSGRRRRTVQRLLAGGRAPGPRIAASPGVPGVGLAVLLGALAPLPRALFRRVDVLQVPERRGPIRVVTQRFLDHAHAAGLQVHVWVVNDEPAMHRLLEMGVDGIMSDRADVLARVMKERGTWPQARQER